MSTGTAMNIECYCEDISQDESDASSLNEGGETQTQKWQPEDLIKKIECFKRDSKTSFADPDNLTTIHFSPFFYPYAEDIKVFMANNDLQESVTWLREAASVFFTDSDFEIELLPSEDDESNSIALKVYGAFPVREFRKLRHLICEAMLNANHKPLYEIISIFQRRLRGNGRQEFSNYGDIS